MEKSVQHYIIQDIVAYYKTVEDDTTQAVWRTYRDATEHKVIQQIALDDSTTQFNTAQHNTA